MIVTVRKHEGFSISEPINDPKNEPINKQIKRATNRQGMIINAIKENSRITLEQIAQEIGISKATVKREVTLMRQDGIIIRIGSNKAGYWEINN